MENVMKGKKDKTIKKIIDKKMQSWIASITDERVRDIASKNVIVTGGCIASMAMGDRVNDFDVYFRTKESTAAIAEYYANVANTSGFMPDELEVEIRHEKKTNIKGETEERVINYIQSAGVAGNEQESEDGDSISNDEDCNKYEIRFISENAITLSGSVQIVTRFYGEPEEIHRNYDFIHAMCYYDYHKSELSMPVEALRSMMTRTLQYKGSLYPICSLFRLRKFIKRGWNVSAGQIFKIAHQISEIDLTDKDILREQLTGVDQLYFNELVNALENAPDDFDSTYVAEIIDRMEG